MEILQLLCAHAVARWLILLTTELIAPTVVFITS
jgi:hypothetical protein